MQKLQAIANEMQRDISGSKETLALAYEIHGREENVTTSKKRMRPNKTNVPKKCLRPPHK